MVSAFFSGKPFRRWRPRRGRHPFHGTAWLILTAGFWRRAQRRRPQSRRRGGRRQRRRHRAKSPTCRPACPPPQTHYRYGLPHPDQPRAAPLGSTCYGWADRPGTFSAPSLVSPQKSCARLSGCFEREPRAPFAARFPVYGFLAERLSQRGVLRAPHFNIVTDSISINSLWTRPACAGLVCAESRNGRVVRRMGVPADRLYEYGFPVQPFFAEHAGQFVPPTLPLARGLLCSTSSTPACAPPRRPRAHCSPAPTGP